MKQTTSTLECQRQKDRDIGKNKGKIYHLGNGKFFLLLLYNLKSKVNYMVHLQLIIKSAKKF
ncbi:MAG: hypothetical protein K2O03_06765, partial [Lachnospiraceae bacterium]|nr:hypothetical protein [Lachnospiraceae bacterium]